MAVEARKLCARSAARSLPRCGRGTRRPCKGASLGAPCDGARYGDYEVGKDRLAAYGVAGLVAGIIAGKTANVGAFAALALFGKKFAVAIGIGVVALLSRVKSLFRRKNQTS